MGFKARISLLRAGIKALIRKGLFVVCYEQGGLRDEGYVCEG